MLSKISIILLLFITPIFTGCNVSSDIFEKNFSLSSVASFQNDLPELKAIWFFCEKCLGDISCKYNYINQCNTVTIPGRNEALARAVESANIEAVYFLVNVAKADVNGVTGRYQETPLSIAAYYGTKAHQKIAEFLLSHGADIDATGLTSKTALMTAIWKENTDFAKFLLKNAANPSATPRGDIDGLACRYAAKKNLINLLPSIPGCCSLILNNQDVTNNIIFQCKTVKL